ncbi:MAG: 1,3-propanediol dehydrogenase [Candidatus Moranbacteria bacterium GW2011_GWE1_35_17]|nr:MAG: 1,3-propanediol dehydrogenase [Candidatus Moranbacteria bacterium GW2011_GWE2_35_164]KKP68662.1 MAG: 1,3-propanediol dehydrogenase [Candidatus Moranbacteria bacterium GW2011_GWE1_35_17]KKP85020.1 MAG: 1,3-propanediol dehydrogenase [Candidatus Moranbacteria bacterium GW2011_GWF2_35_54]
MEEKVNGYFMPTINLMGFGSAKKIGEQIALTGKKKAFIVTDKGLSSVGTPELIKGYIEDAGFSAVIWDNTCANPTDVNVHEGVDAYKKNECDLIISLGGGSPHDCAKGIKLVVDNGGRVNDYEGMDKSTKSVTPLIAINTTAGTASEITRFCIITDTARKVKMAIVDWRTTPTASINDPALMVAMPASLTAATGMDALTHAVEAYVSIIATPVTDCAAVKAIELISKWLREAVTDGNNLEAREQMTYAELLAGMAFNNASLGYVHAMAHQLGGFYDLPHGVCNAILLPHVCEFNLDANPERFADIAKALGENIEGLSTEEGAKKGIAAIKKLSQDIDIPANLAELGVKEEDLEIMAANAMKDACSFTNPKTATLEDVINVYKAALN